MRQGFSRCWTEDGRPTTEDKIKRGASEDAPLDLWLVVA
jgi:hypothetical protein